MKQIVGGFSNPDGTPVAGGRMFLKLTQDASAIGGPLIAGSDLVSFDLDSNGQLPSNAFIWYNDELTPSGTAYQVSVLAKGGGPVYGPEFFIFAGTSPSNIDNMFPSTFGDSVPVFSAAVLQNPVAAQSIVGFPLSIGNTTFNGTSGLITKYNNISTVGNGVRSEVAAVNLLNQNGAVNTTTLYAVPASGAGQYCVSWNAKVTTPAGVSSTLGALTVVYTDPDGVVQTIVATGQTRTSAIAATETTNTTVAVLLGMPLQLNCKASTNITYAMAYASNAANAMIYNLHITLESL